MQTVILCGGMGTRLSEETGTKPKPMVEIGDRPIVWHIMKGYAHHGHHDFVLCLGYLGHVIKRYFFDYELLARDFTVQLGKHQINYRDAHHENDWSVTLADTGASTMTGGRIKRVERYITGDRFFATYGDGVADVDITKALAFHRDHGKLATVSGVRPSSRFGQLIIDGNRVTQFEEKPQTGASLINGGFFIFERGIFDYLSDDPDCVLEHEPLTQLAQQGELMVYQHQGFWQCMDTTRDLQILRRAWDSGTAPWRLWK